LLSVVTYLWGNKGRHFDPSHVNVLQQMIARHWRGGQWYFVCITDATKGFSREVNVLPEPAGASALAALPTPEGARFPSCYRRLWTFSAEAKILGTRTLLLDIDAVVTGDLSPLLEYPGDFVGWYPYRDWGRQKRRFGGGIFALTPGTRTAVYDDFIRDPRAAIAAARAAGFRGSDQAWISYKLCNSSPHFPKDAGIHSVRDPYVSARGVPSDTRIVHFNGNVKPWASPWPWVKQQWNSY
jgi:hypothetical protein